MYLQQDWASLHLIGHQPEYALVLLCTSSTLHETKLNKVLDELVKEATLHTYRKLRFKSRRKKPPSPGARYGSKKKGKRFQEERYLMLSQSG